MQFNLLPDVKLEYVRTRRMQRMVIVIATIVTLATTALFIFTLVYVKVIQQKSLRDVNKDIASNSKTLKEIPELDKILTVQNQLASYPAISDQRPAVTRLGGYLQRITPNNVQISQLQVDFSGTTIIFNGSADTLDAVNTFVDTLKFATYKIDEPDAESVKAFSNVVLLSFSRSEKNASYSISMNYDATIFDTTKKVAITVPDIISTRSNVSQPNALFKATPPADAGVKKQ